jgi:hypothetical protein
MSGPFGSSQWMYASGGFYGTEIDNSLRFNDDDSAYLQRTAGTPTNNKIWTLSCWVKLGNLGFSRTIFSGVSSTSAYDQLTFNSSNQFFMQFANSGVYGQWTSTQVFRDVGSWGHLVVKADTTAGSNGVTVYWNNEVVSGSWAAASLASNASFASINASGDAQRFSLLDTGVSAQYFDGYVADAYFIDGSALDPTSFGETKSGIWIPKEYSGSYGTNGFHLEFAGNANDTSGNGNNFTANNISSYDYVPDTPTNNFSTLSPLTAGSVGTLTQGNLEPGNGSGADAHGIAGTFGMPAGTGKWYWEVFIDNPNVGDNYPYVGACAGQRLNSNSTYGTRGTDLKLNCGTGGVDTSTTYVGSITTVTTGLSRIEDNNILGVAVDMENRKMWFSENGVFPNSGNPATGTNPTFTWTNDIDLFPHWFSYNTYGSGSVWNFGQDSSFVGNKTAQGNTDANGVGDFYYTPPSGFLAMCSANLPDPAIDPAADDTPADYFNTVLYTGANPNAAQSVTGVGFQPDFVWIKSRVTDYGHALHDVIRGANGRLQSNTLGAESISSTYLTSFDSDGFSLGVDYGQNAPSEPYVAWNWKAGGTGVSNTDGSITSTVSANQDSGFSVVTYTGNATAGATVGHGLGKKPTMIIVKNRDDGAQDWPVQHGSIGATGQMVLSSTAANNANIVYWNNTEPTSSVFSLGTANNTNQSGDSHVAYCFTDIDGFSKAGSYVGNGSSDGTFIYTGFRPAWVVVKRYDSSNNWNSHDNKRGPYNVNDWRLYLNLSSAEDSGGSYGVDFLSNGFKVRTSEAGWNASGGTYIYLAFAEQPFKYANAR